MSTLGRFALLALLAAVMAACATPSLFHYVGEVAGYTGVVAAVSLVIVAIVFSAMAVEGVEL